MERATGLLIIEVRNSNPNGNPDAESDPRQRDDKRGEISPVSLKRKLRDLVEDKDGEVWKSMASELRLSADHFHILESREVKRPYVTKLLKEKDLKKFKQTYWDGRVFGNTFLEEGQGDTIRTGVVHFGLALSVAPVDIERLTFTKKAPAQGAKAGGKAPTRGMAPMGFRIVKHGIYVAPFFVNPSAAHKSGCEDKDIELLYRLLPYMFDHTRSMIRSMVGIVNAHVVFHKTALGSFNDFEMIDALTPRLKDKNAEKVSDYVIPEWSQVPQSLRNKAKKYRDLMSDK